MFIEFEADSIFDHSQFTHESPVTAETEHRVGNIERRAPNWKQQQKVAENRLYDVSEFHELINSERSTPQTYRPKWKWFLPALHWQPLSFHDVCCSFICSASALGVPGVPCHHLIRLMCFALSVTSDERAIPRDSTDFTRWMLLIVILTFDWINFDARKCASASTIHPHPVEMCGEPSRDKNARHKIRNLIANANNDDEKLVVEDFVGCGEPRATR